MAIEKVFPEVLRDPILRKVQFSEVGRLDDLGMIQSNPATPDRTNVSQYLKSTTSSSATSSRERKSSRFSTTIPSNFAESSVRRLNSP